MARVITSLLAGLALIVSIGCSKRQEAVSMASDSTEDRIDAKFVEKQLREARRTQLRESDSQDVVKPVLASRGKKSTESKAQDGDEEKLTLEKESPEREIAQAKPAAETKKAPEKKAPERKTATEETKKNPEKKADKKPEKKATDKKSSGKKTGEAKPADKIVAEKQPVTFFSAPTTYLRGLFSSRQPAEAKPEEKVIDKKAVDKKPGGKKSAEKKSAEMKAVEKKETRKKIGEKKVAEKKVAEKKPDAAKSGGKKIAEKKPKAAKPAEKKVAEKKSDAGKPVGRKFAEPTFIENRRVGRMHAVHNEAANATEPPLAQFAEHAMKPVEETALREPAPVREPAAMAEEAPAPVPGKNANASGERYAVQAGAFRSKDNAEKLATKLKAKGFDVKVLSFEQGQGTLYLVRVEDTVPTMTEARQVVGKLKSAEPAVRAQIIATN